MKPTTEQNQDFNPNKPKVSLRRFTDPLHRIAIREFEINRGSEAESVSLKNVYEILGRG